MRTIVMASLSGGLDQSILAINVAVGAVVWRGLKVQLLDSHPYGAVANWGRHRLNPRGPDVTSARLRELPTTINRAKK